MGRPQLTRVAALAVFAFALARAPGVARAQTAEDKAAADAAFDQGKRLMAAHSYAEACQKFSESLRRDPGIGTMLGLADCYEKNGQTASAWAQFREAASNAARKADGREKVARDNAQRLEPLLSRLVVHVAAESDVRGLQVKRDGIDVGRALWDSAIPLDPGVHTVSASAPGKKEWQASITIAPQAGSQTMNVPALEDAPVVAAPPTAVAPAPPAPAPAAPLAHDDPGRTQRFVALGVGGAGVLGIAVGAIFGLQAKGKLDDSNAGNHCDASDACDATGLSLRSDAKSAALVSTLGFAIGTAAVAGGVVLWLTAPKSAGHEARDASRGDKRDNRDIVRLGVAPTPGGAMVIGAF